MSLERDGRQFGSRLDAGFGEMFRIMNLTDPWGGPNRYISQASVSYKPLKNGLRFDFGKFYTSVGAEGPETYNNFSYSRSLLFTLGEPYYHFGLRATIPLMWRHIASSDSKDMAAMEQDIQRLKQATDAQLSEVEKAIFADQEREIFVKIKPGLERYYRAWDAILPLSRAGKNDKAYKQFIAECTPVFVGVIDTARAETEYNRRTGHKYSATAAATGSRTTWMTWVVLIVSMLAGSGAMFWMVRSINTVLKRCAIELSEGSEQITSAASQVASSSQALAQGASEQAASLEETSASTSEITSMTRKNAENSKSAAVVMATVDQGRQPDPGPNGGFHAADQCI